MLQENIYALELFNVSIMVHNSDFFQRLEWDFLGINSIIARMYC